jgi:hypothetical protein
MKKSTLYGLFIGSALGTLSLSAFAQQSSFTTSDVLGMFANQGVVGSRANTLTVSEAHRTCIATMSSGEQSASKFDGDGHAAYKSCMADYVPFKLTGTGGSGACPSMSVSWGECGADLPAQPDGSLFSAKNSVDATNFEGFANFQCSGGQWEYTNGGCSRAVSKCEDGEIVSWGVTSPLWADDSRATVFVDRFGVERHTPKAHCVASMPESLSGKLVIAKPTIPEMEEPERYDMAASQAPNRCFNKEWLMEPGSGVTRCDYIPKSCPAKVYKHPTGCEYALPAGQHDEVYASSRPQPENSIGGIQAHCWDGEWEIKTATCTLSCAPSVPAYDWSSGVSGVDRMCHHDSQSYPTRLAPGTNLFIENSTAGMSGSAGYVCDNGTLKRTNEACAPKGCDGLPSGSWTENGQTCSHPGLPGNYQHGQTVVQQVGDLFAESSGQASYICKYGQFELVSGSESCKLNNNDDTICDATGETTCPANSIAYPGGICCTLDGKCSTGGEDPEPPVVTDPPEVTDPPGGGDGDVGAIAFLDTVHAGCYVDTTGFDYPTDGSCESSGYRSHSEAGIVFSVGDILPSDNWRMSVSGVTVVWSGDCTGVGSMCSISGTCRMGSQGKPSCRALGPKSATATVTYQGQTRVFQLFAEDNTTDAGYEIPK